MPDFSTIPDLGRTAPEENTLTICKTNFQSMKPSTCSFLPLFSDRVSRTLANLLGIALLTVGTLFCSTAAAQQAAAPVFQPTSAIGAIPFAIAVSSSTPGATLYYTTDGSVPSSASVPVPGSGTVSVATNLTLKAIAYATGYAPSAVTSADYKVSGAVGGGSDYAVALKSNGTLWAWGAQDNGRLANGSATGTGIL